MQRHLQLYRCMLALLMCVALICMLALLTYVALLMQVALLMCVGLVDGWHVGQIDACGLPMLVALLIRVCLVVACWPS